MEELPNDEMRSCIEVNDKGQLYEDFYRVVVQNERFDDWTPTLFELKKIINEYRDFILSYHDLGDKNHSVRPRISSAKEGNFLEVLNVSLNTFENHFLNRNLDRTGQVCPLMHMCALVGGAGDPPPYRRNFTKNLAYPPP